jgi:hypothetical protein
MAAMAEDRAAAVLGQCPDNHAIQNNRCSGGRDPVADPAPERLAGI